MAPMIVQSNVVSNDNTSLYCCQHIRELSIIHLHAIVQINGNHLVGEVVDFFLVLPQLVCLGLQSVQALGQLHALGGGGVIQSLLHVGDGGAVAALHLVHIVGADAGDGVRLVAVHVDQRLEAILLAAVEQPVNRALLVDLQMVFVEVVQEVIPDDLAGGAFAAQRVGNEL